MAIFGGMRRCGALALGCALAFALAFAPGWPLAVGRALAAAPTPSAAQGAAPEFGFAEPYFESVGDRESIPEGLVTALAQDAKGWIWIGTQAGLVRYDGYRFRMFSHLAADPASLPGDYISALWSAPDGRLWVGTNSDGVAVFDPLTERFSRPGSGGGGAPSGAVGAGILALAGGADGGVWVGTDAGLDLWLPGAATARHFSHDAADPSSLADNRVRSLLVDRHGTLWVGTAQGLQRRRKDGKGFERVGTAAAASPTAGTTASPAASPAASPTASPATTPTATSATTSTASSAAHSAANPSAGSTAGSSASSSTSSTASSSASSTANPARPGADGAVSLAGKRVSALFEAADGKLWIGTRLHGAAWLEPDTLRLHWLTPDPARADRLSHGWVTAFAQPSPDRIWISTYGGGTNIIDPADGSVLLRQRHDPSNPSGLGLDAVSTLLADRSGLLWVGGWGGGLQRHNPKNRTFRLLRHSPARPAGLSHPDVRSLLELPDGRILAGTGSNGIDILDRRLGLIGGHRPQPGRPGFLGDGAIIALEAEKDGTLWAGTRQAGVFRLAPGAGPDAWQRFSTAQGLPSTLVVKLFAARDGTLWAGTSGGLARWAPGRQRFEAIGKSDGGAMGAPAFALAEDAGGRLWVASDAGLWVVAPGASSLQAIPHDPARADSLASVDLYGLLADRAGRLWVDTKMGLELLKSWDGKRATFEHASALAGKPGKYLGGNLLEDGQGRIWTQGFVLDPKRMRLWELGKPDGIDIGTAWAGSYAATRDGLFLFGGTQGVAVVDPARFQPWDFQPHVRASELAIDGKPVAVGLLAPGLVLGPDQRSFSVRFSATDYSAPPRNLYSYRLQGYDADWIKSDSDHRNASYGNLKPGGYTLQVRASNRLGEWSGHQLEIPVTILPAFWQTTWFLALALLALCGTIYGGYRWRAAALHARARGLAQLVELRTADIAAANASLKETQIRLIESEKMAAQAEKIAALGGLVVGMAHEINTPVGIGVTAASSLRERVVGLAGLYRRGAMKKRDLEGFMDEADRCSEMILTNLERAAGLVQTFKSISLEQSGEARQRFRVKEQIREVFAVLRPRLEAAGVAWRVDCPDGLEFESYAGVFSQILSHLADNCLQHAFAPGQSGNITLEVRAGAGMLRLSFADDGQGIKPEVLSNIFDPFFTTKRGKGRTGLGLHIVHNLVTQAFRGGIECRSTPGQGCVFTLTLQMD